MTIQYTPKFKKQYKKLPKQFQDQFAERLQLFLRDPKSPQLRVHPLVGKFVGYWSLNVNGDLRAIYLMQADEVILFALIGSHSELYG